MKKLKEETIEKRVVDFIARNKYLQPKYLKNLIAQVAHYQSTVAMSKLFCSVGCSTRGATVTLLNKRKTPSHAFTGYLCFDCLRRIEKHIGQTIVCDHCP